MRCAETTCARAFQLYSLGVCTSFTLSQIGMVRHWNPELAGAGGARRRRIHGHRLINAVGAVLTATVLVVLAIKVTHGAYLVPRDLVSVPCQLDSSHHRRVDHVRHPVRNQLTGTCWSVLSRR